MNKPLISFIVPLFNNIDDTRAMLATLLSTLPEALSYEIILIDDFSTDGTREWISNIYNPSIKATMNASNIGFARSCNTGAGLAQGEVLGFLNNDLVFDCLWLEPMLRIIESNDLNAGLVGNNQYRFSDGGLDHAGIRLNFLGQFEHINTELEDGSGEVVSLASTGACFLIRRSTFQMLGGFDERFLNGCEDIDLCFRVRAAGMKVYVATKSHVRHHVSLTRKRDATVNSMNSRYLIKKWRNLIKNELSLLWEKSLCSDDNYYSSYLDGKLTEPFLENRRLAGRVIAEAVIAREECSLSRTIALLEVGPEREFQCKALNLQHSPKDDAYSFSGHADFLFSGLCSARNFYVCGRRHFSIPQRPIFVVIELNGMQIKKTPVMGVEINVGIIFPILSVRGENFFRVWVEQEAVHAPSDECSANKFLLTHIVIDDIIVKYF